MNKLNVLLGIAAAAASTDFGKPYDLPNKAGRGKRSKRSPVFKDPNRSPRRAIKLLQRLKRGPATARKKV